MHVHHHSAKLGGLLNVTLRPLYHVVHVEGFLTSLGHCLKDREAKGDIGDEGTVHHIEVKPVGITAVNHVDVAVEMEEVGSEQ